MAEPARLVLTYVQAIIRSFIQEATATIVVARIITAQPAKSLGKERAKDSNRSGSPGVVETEAMETEDAEKATNDYQ